MTLPAGATETSQPFGFGSARGGVAVPSPIFGAAGQQSIARTLSIYLPEVYPIPDAQQFNPEGDIDSAVAQSDVLIPGTTVRVPNGNIAVIRGLSLYIDNMLTTTDVRFTLRFDGNPVNGFSNLKIFPRVAPSVANGFDSIIRVPNGAVITVTFTQVDGGSYKIGAAFSGWSWPITSGDRWTSLGY